MTIKKQRVGVIFTMASSPKVEYKSVQNYVVKFGHDNEIDYLILCYNVDRNFQFVSLRTGCIHNLTFESIEAAEAWLYGFAEVRLKNGMETTYIP